MKLKKEYWIFGFIIIIIAFIFIMYIQQQLKEKKEEIPESELVDESISNIPQLGNLCTGEDECKDFCLNNRGRCDEYCKENEDELCKIIFLPEEPLTEKNIESERQEVCEGTKTKFDFAPVNLDKTKVFLPLGLMIDSHVTPIDHHYFQNFDNEGYNIEIYSPGDGYITDIGHMPGAKNGEDYRVVIEHTCTISSVYIHLGTFAEKFKPYAPDNNSYVSLRIPVKGDELIGYYEKNVDYNLVDEEVVLSGFVVPDHYRGESWKIHVPNTYDYFNEPVRSKLIEKSVRTAEPISGKIDYDIDGKLVGNWFLEGTDGYAGDTSLERYWLGHLSIVYDAYDPKRIVISIGNYGEENSKQFGVKGNSPDPASVGIENFLVKYELVKYDHITPSGNSWDVISLVKDLKTVSNEIVQGVALVQMLENRKIKFEAFPGKKASEVIGFTSAARIYER